MTIIPSRSGFTFTITTAPNLQNRYDHTTALCEREQRLSKVVIRLEAHRTAEAA